MGAERTAVGPTASRRHSSAERFLMLCIFVTLKECKDRKIQRKRMSFREINEWLLSTSEKVKEWMVDR
jgi:hypothetical protein